VTVALTVRLPDDYHELLIAELADLGFDAFEREEGAVVAYGPVAVWTGVAREAVADWLRARGLDEAVEEEAIPATNWNARWEATIEPIPVGRFVVAPTWAPIPGAYADRVPLRIDPKMSFGTGYHESTRLALRFTPGLVRSRARVLDAGTGTGILAIAALRLGAAEAVAFDIDPWAVENATENAALNGVADRIELREGGLEVVPEAGFDLAFANINRNVLEAMLPDLAAKLAAGGRLVLAGLLRTDRDGMLAAVEAAGLALYDEATENEWWACVVEKG